MEQVSGVALPELYRRQLLGPLGLTHTEVSNSSSNARATALDLARLGQMLLNRGAYGDRRFLDEKSVAELMVPHPMTSVLGPGATQRRGMGTTFLVDEGGFAATNALGKGIYTHGSASRTRLLIDPEHDLLVVIARNDFQAAPADKHEAALLKVIAESLVKPNE